VTLHRATTGSPASEADLESPNVTTAERYVEFAATEARGRSPLYERLSFDIANDDEILGLLERVPEPKRQPNLFFASTRYLGWSGADFQSLRTFVLAHAGQIQELLRERTTQTNEVGRCSVLLPALARIDGPVALLEVGAGLCLLIDRFHYTYGTFQIGDAASGVGLDCALLGRDPSIARMPMISWRRGVDLEPIDVLDPAQTRWLEACVWADQPYRLARLRAAIDLAVTDPPPVVRGNLLDVTLTLASEAPAGSNLVVMHSATLAYLDPAERERFAEMMHALDCSWLSNEAAGVVPGLDAELSSVATRRSAFILADGSRVLGLADPHGTWLELMDQP
jgi:hypothetical protein